MSKTPALQLQNISKTYRKGKKSVYAVKNLDLEVEAGQVYGFLGPNVAGKSTTIRMLMDLIHPTAGQSLINGEPVYKNPAALIKVCALVEGALFYNY